MINKKATGIKHTQQKKVTRLIKIVDRSGSMTNIVNEMRYLLNQNIQQDRDNAEKTGETYITLVTFDDRIETLLSNALIDEVEGDVSEDQIKPRGMTALYDALYTTLNKAADLVGKDIMFGYNAGVLVEIYSDGGENSSRYCDGKTIAGLISRLKETGKWTFQYYGCDETAIKQAQDLGLPTMKFDPTPEGMVQLQHSNAMQKMTYSYTRFAGLTAQVSLEDSTPIQK